MSLTGLQKSILLSVSYSNVFSTPLNSREVWLRLITKERVSLEKVKKSLHKLVGDGYLTNYGQYYSILDEDLSSLRLKREEYSRGKFLEANSLISIAKLIPFIKAIVVTGSLSVSNAKQNDDVDWLIITSKNTLWIARPLLIIIASFYGKRRRRDGDHRDNSWCFNMFMTEESLSISKKKRSIYTAYEVCQAKFIYDSANIEKKFLKKNDWVSKYLNNFLNSRLKNLNYKKVVNKYQCNSNIFITLLNTILFYIQYQYMKKRITREVVQKDLAFFHPRNTHNKVLTKWKQILKN